MGDDQRQRTLVPGTHVNEMNVEPVDLGRELWQSIQLGFCRAPVVLLAPVTCQTTSSPAARPASHRPPSRLRATWSRLCACACREGLARENRSGTGGRSCLFAIRIPSQTSLGADSASEYPISAKRRYTTDAPKDRQRRDVGKSLTNRQTGTKTNRQSVSAQAALCAALLPTSLSNPQQAPEFFDILHSHRRHHMGGAIIVSDTSSGEHLKRNGTPHASDSQ